MKNIHVLPTENSSRLSIDDRIFNLHRQQWRKGGQHIYITSDEEIKEGDWCLFDRFPNKIHKAISNMSSSGSAKKIILTTDQNLIADGVQAIDDDFLEWFVKNPSCKEVEITKVADLDLYYKNGIGGQKHKIIIPKEEYELKQQERSYSEEDMIEFGKYLLQLSNSVMSRKFNMKMLDSETGTKLTKDLFEQFKKK
jgi:hypothetical protein